MHTCGRGRQRRRRGRRKKKCRIGSQLPRSIADADGRTDGRTDSPSRPGNSAPPLLLKRTSPRPAHQGHRVTSPPRLRSAVLVLSASRPLVQFLPSIPNVSIFFHPLPTVHNNSEVAALRWPFQAAKAVSDGWAKFGLKTERRCKFLATTESRCSLSLSLSLSLRLKLSKLAPLECAGGGSKVCSGGKKSALSGRRERRSRRRHRDTIGFLLNKVEWPHGGERAGRKEGRRAGRKEGWLVEGPHPISPCLG